MIKNRKKIINIYTYEKEDKDIANVSSPVPIYNLQPICHTI